MNKIEQLVGDFEKFVFENHTDPFFWIAACVVIVVVVFILGGSLKEK